ANKDDFLDWDKPLRGQSQNASAAFRNMVEDVERKTLGRDPALGPVPEQLSRLKDRLQQFHGRQNDTPLGQWAAAESLDKATLDAMKEAGIPGIKYLDGNSRASGQGTYNYVIFDDNLIEITAKNGEPVSADVRREAIAQTQKQFALANGVGSLGDPLAHAATPLANLDMPSIRTEIDKIINRLPEGYKVQLENRLTFQERGGIVEADAVFDPTAKLIKVSLASNDPARFGRHEEIHAYRQLGLFNDDEWNALTTYARDNDLRKAYKIDDRYGELYGNRYKDDPDKLEEMLVEETIAEMWADRVSGKSYGKTIDGLIDRVMRVINAISKMLRGKGYTRIEDVYQRIETGEIGRRAEPSASSDLPPTNVDYQAYQAEMSRTQRMGDVGEVVEACRR
ncbi:MAG: hypothetical protein AAGB04_25110, partial [Pseudomonadota bacterium]